jgi:hypothetical protein
MDGVRATLNYLAPGSTRNRLYVAPGDYLATARYEPRTVRIASGRACREEFTLDRTGFTLVDHRSAVADLSDTARLDEVYTPESHRAAQRRFLLVTPLISSRRDECRAVPGS